MEEEEEEEDEDNSGEEEEEENEDNSGEEESEEEEEESGDDRKVAATTKRERSGKRKREEDDDDDDDSDTPLELEPLKESEEKLLLDYLQRDDAQTGDNWYWGNEGGNPGRVLFNLADPGHLNMWNGGNILGNAKEVQEDIRVVVEDEKILTERYDKLNGKGRSSAASSGQLHVRTLHKLQKRRNYRNIIKTIKKLHEEKWKKEGKLRPNQKVVITKCWFNKALNKKENKGDGDAGDFAKHYDNFGRGSLVRVVVTIMDVEKGNKVMAFEHESGNDVMFGVPHGSIISMDGEAAGSNKARHYMHGIKGAEDTYTLCLELGIGDENHGDLRGCTWKEGDDEGIEGEEAWENAWNEDHENGE